LAFGPLLGKHEGFSPKHNIHEPLNYIVSPYLLLPIMGNFENNTPTIKRADKILFQTGEPKSPILKGESHSP
jgi:hypothetical protein